MVILDASFVLLLIELDAKPPKDPTTGKDVDKCKERIEYLVARLAIEKTPVVVPAPALSEFLVRAGRAASDYLTELQNNRAIRVESFGQRAAVECAFLIDGAKRHGKKSAVETWAKLKFDRQILAIAKVGGATTIYTNDQRLAKLALQNGMNAIAVHELPLPPVDPQMPLELPPVPEDES
jgi:predicted nucleic acid-binding protein